MISIVGTNQRNSRMHPSLSVKSSL